MKRRKKITEKDIYKKIFCENNKKYVHNFHTMKCPYCGGKMNYQTSDGIYRSDKIFNMLYVCENHPKCDCYVRAKDITCEVGNGNCKNCNNCSSYNPITEVEEVSGYTNDEKQLYNMPKCQIYNTCQKYSPLYRKLTKEEYLAQEPSSPIGRPANGQLRQLRAEAHYYFDLLGKLNVFTSIGEMYSWLSYSLSIPIQETHIAYFDEYYCKKTIELCVEVLSNHRSRFKNPITLFNSNNLNHKTYSEQNKVIQDSIENINITIRKNRKY